MNIQTNLSEILNDRLIVKLNKLISANLIHNLNVSCMRPKAVVHSSKRHTSLSAM
jgi:hypothetical protein